MISHLKVKKWLRPALCGLALVGSTTLGQAQTAQDYIVNQFDDGAGGNLWSANYGTAPITIEYDSVEDRGPGAVPGSMKVTIDFNLCATDPVSIQRDFEKVLSDTLDLTKYTKLHFSVKVDPSSSHLSDWGNGAFGNIRPHIRLSSWGGDSNLGSDGGGSQWVGTDAYGGWVDYAYNIDQTLDNLATRQAAGILGFDIWSGWGSCAAPIGHTNTVIFWLDNIWFEFNTNTAPPLPPTMDLAKAGPSGVKITTDDNSSQWQRDAISTPTNSGPYLWASQSSYPVSYSCTISEFPAAASHKGFEAHMYVANEDTAPANSATSGSPDWGVPDIFIFRVENHVTETYTTNGATITTNFTYDARAQIQWKTNYPNANATNIPVIVDVPSALGTWTVTFTDDTSGTLTGPGITATNFTLPADAVLNNFKPTASFLQFGMFKNDEANDGHNNQAHGTFSHVKFTAGATAPIDDDFSGATLTNKYAWRKTSASAVQFIAPGSAWLVGWTLPASFFFAESAPTVTGPWSNAGLTNTYTSGGKAHVVVPSSALPAGNAAYFRLKQIIPAAPPVLLESFESGSPFPAASSPYFNFEQSTAAGVTEGANSLHVSYTNDMTWTWMDSTDYGATGYNAWKTHTKLVFDLHRAAFTDGWNLDFVVAMDGSQSWYQPADVVNWVWQNGGVETSQTITVDYSSVLAAAPATGTSWKLHFMLRGNGGDANGHCGDVYIDNIRFEN